jgi:UrcA family protein
MSTAKTNSTSTITRSFRQLALAALVCALGSATAWAAPDARSITVSFRDLDLSNIAGATTLYHRIQQAARQVCGRAASDLYEQIAWTTCYRNSTADAVRKVNSPLLTAVHTGRSPAVTAMLSK